MDSSHQHAPARARRGTHARAKGQAPWWERVGESPPCAGMEPSAGRRRRRSKRLHPAAIAGLSLVVIALPLVAFARGSTKTRAKTAAHSPEPIKPVVANILPGGVVPVVESVAPSTAPSTTAPTTAPTTSAAAPVYTAPPATAAKRESPKPAAAPVYTAPKPVAPAPRPVVTAPPPPPPPPPPPANSQAGQGTWYRYKPGGCANNSLPMGTLVHVTNAATGATATCVVNDRGAFGYPTILDMDASVFQQLAPLSAGRINITISW